MAQKRSCDALEKDDDPKHDPETPDDPAEITTKSMNAFSTLMQSRKIPKILPSISLSQSTTSKTPDSSSVKTTFLGRDGLGAYITDPASFPSSRVIYFNDDFVVINDLFPKSMLHLLILPRDPVKSLLHPFDAFDITSGINGDFLARVRGETKKVKELAAKELRRRIGKYSKLEQTHKDSQSKIQRGTRSSPSSISCSDERDYNKSIISGIHAVPSMNHLHIHVLSVDRVNECMRHRKHYNSFATPFLIDVEDFPLKEDDPRRHPGKEGYLQRDLICWRCERNFGNRFARLKDHLQEEFEAWQAE